MSSKTGSRIAIHSPVVDPLPAIPSSGKPPRAPRSSLSRSPAPADFLWKQLLRKGVSRLGGQATTDSLAPPISVNGPLPKLPLAPAKRRFRVQDYLPSLDRRMMTSLQPSDAVQGVHTLCALAVARWVKARADGVSRRLIGFGKGESLGSSSSSACVFLYERIYHSCCVCGVPRQNSMLRGTRNPT